MKVEVDLPDSMARQLFAWCRKKKENPRDLLVRAALLFLALMDDKESNQQVERIARRARAEEKR